MVKYTEISLYCNFAVFHQFIVMFKETAFLVVLFFDFFFEAE